MLKNSRQHYHRLPGISSKEQAAVAHAVLRLALKHNFERIVTRFCLLNGDIQSRLTVVALFLCCVIACKLKSMAPLELERYTFQCMSVRRP